LTDREPEEGNGNPPSYHPTTTMTLMGHEKPALTVYFIITYLIAHLPFVNVSHFEDLIEIVVTVNLLRTETSVHILYCFY